ncbi:hypothetical protein L7F22_026683 [Adiantum nelumboides]|nr:hypothetical protein [Adiantum nelumboides]
MKQFLASDAKDKVLTEWRSLKLSPYESIHKYVDKFWDLHLKATVYKKIYFEEQKQQFCAGLPEDMNEYVNSQRPRSISTVIHHTMVAARINFQQGAKRNLKPMEAKDKQEYKGKNLSQNSSKGNSNNNKAKEKGVFKGKNKLTPKELERYRKENECFKCGEQGHSYCSCPQKHTRNEQPRASMVEAPKEDIHCKGSPLSYAWGKVFDCVEDSVFRFVAVFAIVLVGFGLRRGFASRLPDMAVRTSEFELFVTRFDGSDFAWGSSHMLNALTCLGQALPLQGKDARPESMSDRTWEDLDALARSTIMLSLLESVYCIVMHAHTTRDVWQLLCQRYGTSESKDALRARCRMQQRRCQHRLDATALTTLEADVVYEVTHNGHVWMSLPSGALLVLRHVCHVPSLTRSLTSESQLGDNGCHAVLDEHGFSLRHEQLVLARGASVDSTYPMQSSETVVCVPTKVRQLEQATSSCETQLVVQGLCPSVDSSVARQESSDLETMTCVDDRHFDALRSFTDMPLPMSDSLSHGTSCVDVIARETDACEPCMAMLIDTDSEYEPDFREPETNVLFYNASDMFEDDSVLQTSLYDQCESVMIANSASVLDVLSRELLSVGVMSTDWHMRALRMGESKRLTLFCTFG